MPVRSRGSHQPCDGSRVGMGSEACVHSSHSTGKYAHQEGFRAVRNQHVFTLFRGTICVSSQEREPDRAAYHAGHHVKTLAKSPTFSTCSAVVWFPPLWDVTLDPCWAGPFNPALGKSQFHFSVPWGAKSCLPLRSPPNQPPPVPFMLVLAV